MIKLKMWDIKKIFNKNFILKKYNFLYNGYVINKFLILNSEIFDYKKTSYLNMDKKKDVDYINNISYVKEVKETINSNIKKAKNFYNLNKNNDYQRNFYKKYKSKCQIEIWSYTKMLIDDLDSVFIKLWYNSYPYNFIKPFIEFIKYKDVVALEDVENWNLYIYDKAWTVLAMIWRARIENYLFD